MDGPRWSAHKRSSLLRKQCLKGKYESVLGRLLSWVERRERLLNTDMVAKLEFWVRVETGGSVFT
jgi:hypothetical protein